MSDKFTIIEGTALKESIAAIMRIRESNPMRGKVLCEVRDEKTNRIIGWKWK
jgi:hypothetical protein